MLRALLACALLVALYYLIPVEPGVGATARVARTAGAVLAVLAVAVLITRMVRRLLREEPGSRPANLLVALFGGLVLFAYLDYQIATSLPGEFAGLNTKTDGLYFAVVTLTTVGYGDVHATGQLARALVIVQQLFNVGVLATGGAVLVNRLTAGRGTLRPAPGGPPPPPTGR